MVEADTTTTQGPQNGRSNSLGHCPECGSQRLYKDGRRYLRDGSSIQRWLCRGCGLRFSKIGSHSSREPLQKNSEQSLNTSSSIVSNRQICALKVKNLTSAAETKTVAGERRLQTLPQEARGLIAKYMAYLEREGYYQDTSYLKLLSILVKRGADLLNPEDVKTKIAKQQWKDSVKFLAVYAYDAFCKMENISWNPPKYKQQDSEISVPDEKHLDQLISATRSKRLAAFLQCLKETFADPGEILKLEWRDVRDNVISINHPVKGHLSGRMQVSNRLIAMLNALPKDSKRVFPMSYQSAVNSFQKLRKRLAQKLQNPELLHVSFRSYRHWGGSMLAHYTNGNVLTIQKALRHKNIQNTMKYIHTIPFRDEDFEVATATTDEEIKQLGRAGWTKYDEKHGISYYRKPRKYSV
jgi:integrase